MIAREIIAQKLADLDGYFKPQPWNYEAADAILALSLPEPTEGARSQIAANFLRQTMTPLVGRTEPTVSWFGTPDERDVILSALRAMPLQDHARPASEYDASMGSVLWWKFPISEPPYVGNPDDCGFTVEAHTTTRLITQMDQDHDPETTIHRIHAGGWPGYHTHFTLIAMPAAPAILAEERTDG